MEKKLQDLENENRALKIELAKAQGKIKFVIPQSNATKSLKKVLVTGGAGFLGTNLCIYLLSKGYYVICMDNLTSGCHENITELLTNPNFLFLTHDVTVPFEIEVDEIYNLACPASPVAYQSDPIHTFKTSVLGILNVLDLIKGTNTKLLHTSTSEVYGDAKICPQHEEYWGNVNPIGIRACYDEGKRSAECLIFDYIRTYKVKAKFVRIFNTYGPYMKWNDGRVVSNFIVQALQGNDITMYGDGNQTRSFCFADDLIKGLFLMMQTNDEVTGPVNLGMPKQNNLHELASLIIKLTESKSKIIYKPLPSDDPKVREPDITKAKSILKWEPSIPLEEGLVKTINYFNKTLKLN